jgi:hypothetical protein
LGEGHSKDLEFEDRKLPQKHTSVYKVSYIFINNGNLTEEGSQTCTTKTKDQERVNNARSNCCGRKYLQRAYSEQG